MAKIVPTEDMQRAVLVKLIRLMLDGKEFPLVNDEISRYNAAIAISGEWQDNGEFKGYIAVTDTIVSPIQVFDRTSFIDFWVWVDYDENRPGDPVRVYWSCDPGPYGTGKQSNYAPFHPVLGAPTS